jgi:hypothetical protein
MFPHYSIVLTTSVIHVNPVYLQFYSFISCAQGKITTDGIEENLSAPLPEALPLSVIEDVVLLLKTTCGLSSS